MHKNNIKLKYIGDKNVKKNDESAKTNVSSEECYIVSGAGRSCCQPLQC